MALKSTVYKAQLQIADIDNSYYADHALTLARHPSETDERMMVRLAALSLNAYQLQSVCNGDGVLAFGAGLSDPDDPDVSLTDFTGRKRLWIEVGQPDDKVLQRAGSKSDRVLVYAFSSSADIWWRGIENKLHRQQKLGVVRIPHQAAQDMAAMAERSMQLQVTIQEAGMTLSSNRGSVHFEPVVWLCRAVLKRWFVPLRPVCRRSGAILIH